MVDNRCDHPDISVALATRDGGRFVAEQLTSILTQSVRPTEIILSDDDSSDDTVAIARRTIGDQIPLTVLINRPPLGVTANFAQAVGASAGSLIALCDQDDRWYPNRLATILEVFERRPEVSLVHSDARLVDDDGAPLDELLLDALELSAGDRGLIHSGRASEVLLRRSVVTGATTVFRRSLLEVALPFPHGWVHDEWLATLASMVGTVALIEQPLVDYRQHAANEIGARRPTLRQKIRKVLTEPRTARNARLESNYRILVDRLDQLGSAVPPPQNDAARSKLAHEVARSRLPTSRVHRIGPVLGEVRRGAYRQFGHGWQDVARDLLQPAR